MPEALGEDRWAAIRAICEGAAPTQERVALAAGVYVKTIARRSGAEGWAVLDFRRPRIRAAHRALVDLAARAAAGEELDPVAALDGENGEGADAFEAGEGMAALEPLPDLPPVERVARLKAMLTRRSEDLLRRAETGQPIESRQVAALVGMVRLAERITAMAVEEAEEDRREKMIRSDDELRALLQKLDDRVVYLAQGQAFIVMQDYGISQEDIDFTLARLNGTATPEECDAAFRRRPAVQAALAQRLDDDRAEMAARAAGAEAEGSEPTLAQA